MVKLSCSPVGACSFDGGGTCQQHKHEDRDKDTAQSCLAVRRLGGRLGLGRSLGARRDVRGRIEAEGEVSQRRRDRRRQATPSRKRHTRAEQDEEQQQQPVVWFREGKTGAVPGTSRQRAARGVVVVPGRVEPDRVVVRVAGDLAKVRGSSRERLTADGIGDSVHQ